jgi:hypothetical protein
MDFQTLFRKDWQACRGFTREADDNDALNNFRYDYEDFLTTSLMKAADKDSAFCLGNDTQTGAVLEIEDTKISILRGAFVIPGHDVADVVIVANEKKDQHVVLFGQRLKGRLGDGVGGFELPLEQPMQEVEGLFAPYNRFSEKLKAEVADRYERYDRFADYMKPVTDVHALYERYMKPVDMWTTPEQVACLEKLRPGAEPAP